MPRIRKKTSRRSTTNDRRKIARKVRESRKKQAKAAKKNPQWKSKHKTDPGIPHNFPYKDQILAEVAEQRRQAEEEKRRRREEKRAANIDTLNEKDESNNAVEAGTENNFDGIASIAAKHLIKAQASPTKSQPVIEDGNQDEAPLLANPDLPDLKATLEYADVVVNILDARDPLSYRSHHLEEWIRTKPGKRMLFVLNKIDMCPREAVSAWAAYLRTQNNTLLFRSASAFLPSSPEPAHKGKGKVVAKATADALGVDAVLSCLGRWAKQKGGEEPLAVTVVGLTNSGKSSFINSLIKRAALPIYTLSSSPSGPSTTTHAYEVALEVDSAQIRLIDTPGLLWRQSTENHDNSVRTRDILLRNKGRIDRLKDPIPVVTHIIERSTPEDLMLLYNLPAFSRGDTTSFLSGLARTKQLIMKHGKLDLAGASRIVLRDWNTGKFPRYTMPPAKDALTSYSELTDLFAQDEDILKALPTRKEMRKDQGVVKLSLCEHESREVAMDEPWINIDSDESESDGEGGNTESEVDAGDDRSSGEGEGEEESADEDGSSEEEGAAESDDIQSAPSMKAKRKRATDVTSVQPNKRVAFAIGGKTILPTSKRPSVSSKVAVSKSMPPPAKKTPKLRKNASAVRL